MRVPGHPGPRITVLRQCVIDVRGMVYTKSGKGSKPSVR